MKHLKPAQIIADLDRSTKRFGKHELASFPAPFAFEMRVIHKDHHDASDPPNKGERSRHIPTPVTTESARLASPRKEVSSPDATCGNFVFYLPVAAADQGHTGVRSRSSTEPPKIYPRLPAEPQLSSSKSMSPVR
jgi:hypothetical protein